ncbi:MAG: hypothetical protein M3O78_00385 [Chloroflexota bacterium]|nr:hypothetical protein [Chloroflexota bacterium]
MVPPSFGVIGHLTDHALTPALSGGTRPGSRATFSLSSAAGSQPMARLSAAADGGLLLTFSAVLGV